MPRGMRTVAPPDRPLPPAAPARHNPEGHTRALAHCCTRRGRPVRWGGPEVTRHDSPDLRWLLVLLLFGAFAGARGVRAYRRAAAGKGLPDYTVYSAEPDGLADAASSCAGPAGSRSPSRAHRATRSRGLLVLAEPGNPRGPRPASPSFPRATPGALLRLVEAGNTLLYCGRHATSLHELLGVTLITDETDTADDPHPAEVGEAGLYTDERATASSSRGKTSPETAPRPAAVVGRWPAGRGPAKARPGSRSSRSPIAWPPDNEGLRPVGTTASFSIAWPGATRATARFTSTSITTAFAPAAACGATWRTTGRSWVLVPVLLLAGMAAWSVAVRLGPAVPVPHGAGRRGGLRLRGGAHLTAAPASGVCRRGAGCAASWRR